MSSFNFPFSSFWEEKNHEFPIACVVMASGQSERFEQKDKLLADYRGRALLDWTLSCFSGIDFCLRNVIVRTREVAMLADRHGYRVIWNDGFDQTVAHTIACSLLSIPEDCLGCLFVVGDQPLLTEKTVRNLCECFVADPTRIVSLSFEGKRGNPVIFPKSLYAELFTLNPDESGRSVLNRHAESLVLVEAQSELELFDVDTKEDLAQLNAVPQKNLGDGAQL